MRLIYANCILAVLALTLLTGCQSVVPPELYEANRVQARALAKVDADRQFLINTMIDELQSAFVKQLNLREELILVQNQVLSGTDEAGAPKYVVPREMVDMVSAQKEEQREKFTVQLNLKRQEWLRDDNLDIALKLNDAQGRWLNVVVEQFAQRIQYLVDTGKELIDGDEQ